MAKAVGCDMQIEQDSVQNHVRKRENEKSQGMLLGKVT
jgi:hypothetical protein